MTQTPDIFNVHKKDMRLFAKFVPPPDKGETFANIVVNQSECVINSKNFSKISKKIHATGVVKLTEDVVNLTEETPDEVMDPIDDAEIVDARSIVESRDAEMPPVEDLVLVPIISSIFVEIDAFKSKMATPVKSEIFQTIIDQKSWAGIKRQYIRVTLQYFFTLFKMEGPRYEFIQTAPTYAPNITFMFNDEGLFLKTIIKHLDDGLCITEEGIRSFEPQRRSDDLIKFFIDYSQKVSLPQAPPLSSLDEERRALVLHMFDHFYNLCDPLITSDK